MPGPLASPLDHLHPLYDLSADGISLVSDDAEAKLAEVCGQELDATRILRSHRGAGFDLDADRPSGARQDEVDLGPTMAAEELHVTGGLGKLAENGKMVVHPGLQRGRRAIRPAAGRDGIDGSLDRTSKREELQTRRLLTMRVLADQ